ncbi:NAD(P)/FAD-dependent oxidoreductase [Desulfosporosinus metallidurans]|uniref:Sulfide-quinone reductase n=1 Tax=Desulfosporosinus metallidurans TaxID=1888891 RepID=A0A1Q8QPK6_9FIRM|nr:FAD-dependent oxidoreductase [Desulfosporosinus metallidurans]OLN29275.1 Sulfide-quinone reductase [Desulfosporosinus metallidurans]
MAKIVVIGGSFAGLTAALEARRKLGPEHKVLMISKTDNFVFIPSMIWVPFGWREVEDVTAPLRPILNKAGVEFMHAEATKILPKENKVKTSQGVIDYDYLVVATGPDLDFDSVEGLGPNKGNVECICNPKSALEARKHWKEFLKNPGTVVIGAAPAAGCAGAAYEFLFNMEYALRKNGVRKKTDLYWITPEPFLGHFGIEGIAGGEGMLKAFMKMFNIKYITEAAIEKVDKEKVYLKGGKVIPYKFSMIMPAFMGAKVIRDSEGLANPRGFIPTHDSYQHKEFPNIFAAGIAVDVPPPFKPGKVPLNVPKTGYPSDEAGKVAAENIKRLIEGRYDLQSKPFGKIPGLCIMDAGHKEVIIVSNHLFKPRQFAVMIPNVFYDINKRLFEKYFMWKVRTGRSYLP